MCCSQRKVERAENRRGEEEKEGEDRGGRRERERRRVRMVGLCVCV